MMTTYFKIITFSQHTTPHHTIIWFMMLKADGVAIELIIDHNELTTIQQGDAVKKVGFHTDA